MLIREHVDYSRSTTRKDRHTPPEHFLVLSREVMLDPWEEDECAVHIIFTCGAQKVEPGIWNKMDRTGNPLKGGHGLALILEDPENGYRYYRRPIDSLRQSRWNDDHSCRVSAEEW